MREKENEISLMDESLRRLGGILKSPSLVMSYEHTTPLAEKTWLRRLGLTKEETSRLIGMMCEYGVLDQGARALVIEVCRRKNVSGAEAARLLLKGECWPEGGTDGWDTRA